MEKDPQLRIPFSDYPVDEQMRDEQRIYKDAVYVVALGPCWGWFHPDKSGGSFGFSDPSEKLVDFYPRLRKLYPNTHHIHFTLNPGLEGWLADRLVEVRESQIKGVTIHKISTTTTLASKGLGNRKGGRD